MSTPPPFLIDIGANLSHSAFRHDLGRVIDNARDAGVAHIMVTGTDLESIEAAHSLVIRYPGYLTLTAGFHPHHAGSYDPDARRALERFVAMPEVVAVGEMGLDFNRDYSPRDRQEAAFESQLELASESCKPVFRHQRDAHERFHPILKAWRSRLTGGVVHCFTDTREALHDYLDLDMFIGITGWVCDERRGRDLQALMPDIPADRLLLETDAPYLLPRSLRPKPDSRRNEPGYLVEVLDTVARLRGEDPRELARQCSANARMLFGLPVELPAART
jgi:TatD DNase family protein